MAKNPITVLDEGLKRTEELNGKLKQVIENVLAINDAALKTGKNFFNVKSPNELNDSLKQNKTFVQQLNVELKERQRLEKALATQLERNKQAQTATAKALAQARYETQELNKRAKEAAVLSSKLSTEYQKQAVRLVQLRRAYKDVALTQGESSQVARKLRTEITALDARLKRVDANVGQFQRSVGNYGKAMQSAVGAARNLAGAFGFVGGAFLAAQIIRDAAQTVREFDRQVIAVQKTTNLTNPEIKLFKDEVIQLGLALKGISIQGLLKSSEIAGQLGIKGRSNILKFSETIEKLKLTSDIAGEESARQFAKFIEVSNDSVENADRLGSVITELGNNFATTESQILKNTIEIQKGIAIYDANAQSVLGLGAATNALGAEAEQARSAMQKTFQVLNNAAANGKNLDKVLRLTGQTAAEFRKEFAEDSVKVFERFIKGLADSTAEGENLTNTLKSLGLNEKRTEAVVGVLAKNYDTLSDALSRANNEYKNNVALTKEAEAASKSIDSIIGDVSDAWDGLILSIDKGDGVISRFVKFVLKDLEQGLKRVRTVLGGFSLELQDIQGNAFERYSKALDDKVTKATENNIKELEKLLVKKKEERDEIQKSVDSYEKQISQFSSLTKATSQLAKSTIENSEAKQKELARDNGQISALEDKIKKLKETKKAYDDERKSLIQSIIALDKKQNIDDLQKKNLNELRALYESLNKTLDTHKKSQKEALVALEGSIPFQEAIIQKLEEQRSKLSTTREEYVKYSKAIDEAKDTLIQLKAAIEGVNAGLDVSGLITGLEQGLDLDGIENELDEFFRKREEQEKLLTEFTKQEEQNRNEIRQQFADASLDFVNNLFDVRVQRYEDDINRNRDYYAQLLDNENLTEEQRSALEAERERKEREIEKKKRAEQRKQAIFNKAVNASEIISNTAVAITKTLGQTGFFGIPLTTVVAALGALQLATVLAQPIPQYAEGKNYKDNYEGAAIWGEKKRELKISKDGTMELSPKKIGNHLTHVKKDDIIVPDASKFLSNLSDEQIYNDIHKVSILASMSHQTDMINGYLAMQEKSMEKHTNKIVEALNKKQMSFKVINQNNIAKDIAYMLYTESKK